MKKCLFLIATAVCLVTCARKQEADVTDNRLTFVAKTESSADTRTVVEDETHVFWEPGDEIAVFSGEKSGKFVTNLSSSSATATFTGTLGEDGWVQGQDLWAVYPYSEKAVFDGETITTTLPSIQVARAGSFGKDMNLAVAHSTDNMLQFYNVGGGVRFTVTEDGVKKVIFEGMRGELIAGKVRIGFDEIGIPVVKQFIEGSPYIMVFPPEEGGTFQKNVWYYIVALPNDLHSGYKIRLYRDIDFATRTITKSSVIKRSIYGTIRGADIGIDYESVATPFPQTKEEWETSLAMTDRIRGYYIRPLLQQCLDPSFECDNILDYFISSIPPIEEIIDIYPTQRRDGVIIVQRDGVHYTVFLKGNPEDMASSGSQRSLLPVIEDEPYPELRIVTPNTGQKKALLICPYQTMSFHNLLPIRIDIDYLRYQLLQAGFSLSVYAHTSASLDVFTPDFLEKYDLVLIGTHGSVERDLEGNPVYFGFMSGYTVGEPWSQPEAFKKLAGFLSKDSIRYCATIRWMKAMELFTHAPSFKNTIILAMACDSFTTYEAASYFMERGASAYCGNVGTVPIIEMDEGLCRFVDYLTMGIDVETAANWTRIDFPKIPLKSATMGSEPVYLVDPAPQNLVSSVNSSRVLLQWTKPKVRGDYSIELYIDDELITSDLTLNDKEYVARVYTRGWHCWYLQSKLYVNGEVFETFRSPIEVFMIQEWPEFVDLGLSVKWASFNLGGLCPEDVGDYYAWGEIEPKSRFSWGTYKWCSDPDNPNYIDYYPHTPLTKYNSDDRKVVLDPQDDAAHYLLGQGCRIPTQQEFVELLNNSQIEKTSLGAISGYKFTSTVPGYTDKWIFIVPGGTVDFRAGLWSSNLSSSTPTQAMCLEKDSYSTPPFEIKQMYRFGGLPIRPVCE